MVSDIVCVVLLVVIVVTSVALLPMSRIGRAGVFGISCGLLFAPVVIAGGHGVGIAPFLPVLISSPAFLLLWPNAVSLLVTMGLAFVIGWVAIPAIPITVEGMKRHISRHVGSGNPGAKLAQTWFSLHFLLILILMLTQGRSLAAGTYAWIMLYVTAPIGFVYYALLAFSGMASRAG